MTAPVAKRKPSSSGKSPFFYPSLVELPNIYYSQAFRDQTPIKLGVSDTQFIMLMNKRLNYTAPYSKERTFISALKNGHKDTEVFVYVNAHKKVPAYSKHGHRLTDHVSVGPVRSIVLDVDSSAFGSIAGLIRHLEYHNLPKPRMISQTGEYAFHLVYTFDLMDGCNTVTTEDSLYLALSLNKVSFNESELGNTAKDHVKDLDGNYFKIDYKYLKQDNANAKFRLPGSPKIKIHKDGKRELYTCRGWANPVKATISQHILRAQAGCYEFYGPVHRPEFHWHDGSYIDGLEDIIPINIKEIKAAKPTIAPPSLQKALVIIDTVSKAETEGFWKESIKDFKEEIEKVLPKRYAKRYAEWFSQNLTFLKQGRCAISQVRLGTELDITQVTVSKHLKLLVEAGILWTDHAYSKLKKPKVYRLGQAMVSRLYTIDTSYEIGKEYGAGTTNEQYMGDIRYLHSAGIDKEEIVTLIDIKMQQKPKSRRRKVKEIEKAVDKWAEMCDYRKPPIQLLDFDTLNRQVLGVEYGRQVFRFPHKHRIRSESI